MRQSARILRNSSGRGVTRAVLAGCVYGSGDLPSYSSKSRAIMRAEGRRQGDAILLLPQTQLFSAAAHRAEDDSDSCRHAGHWPYGVHAGERKK